MLKFDRSPLRRCSLTHLMFPGHLFVSKKSTSLLGNKWYAMSQRAINGRYREARTLQGYNLSYVRKGIRMDPAWVNDPTAFAWAVISQIGFPQVNVEGKPLTLDRIENNGHYEIENLRWATFSEQIRNRGPKGAPAWHAIENERTF